MEGEGACKNLVEIGIYCRLLNQDFEDDLDSWVDGLETLEPF